MDFSANRAELLAAVRIAEHIAPSNSAIESLQCAHLIAENERLTVAATNLEVSVEKRIPADPGEDGDVLVNAKLLTDILRLLGGERVSFSQKDNHILRVSSDKTEYSLSVFDTGMYPHIEIPFPEDTVPVTGISSMAKRTVFAASEDANEANTMRRCVHLTFTSEGLKAASTDGARIAYAKGDSKCSGAVDFLILASSLEKLSGLITNKDELKVGLTGKSVVFMKDEFLFSARLVEGRYFDTEALLGMVHGMFTVLTDAKVIRDMFDTVCSVKSGVNRFSMSFNGEKLKMTCESEYGISEVEQTGVPLMGNPTGTYWFNPKQLEGCLKAHSGTMMLEVAQNGALVLKTDDLVCVQLPIREPKPIDRTPKKAKPVKPAKEKKETKKKEKAANKKAA